MKRLLVTAFVILACATPALSAGFQKRAWLYSVGELCLGAGRLDAGDLAKLKAFAAEAAVGLDQATKDAEWSQAQADLDSVVADSGTCAGVRDAVAAIPLVALEQAPPVEREPAANPF